MEEKGGINLYAFVGNNPVNWVDPLGLASVGWDDCRIMEKQEKATCGWWARSMNREKTCSLALVTCDQNCDKADLDKDMCCPTPKEFDKQKCKEECRESFKKCMAGECWKYPDSQYNYWNCKYRKK